MDSQDGKGLLGFLLFVLILFGIMWLAVPWLQKSTLSGDEAAAIGTLRQIYVTQRDHHGATRLYGSLTKMQRPGISNDFFTSSGYEFYHSTTGSGSKWCTVAVPQVQEHATAIGRAERRSGRVFGIDETGVVMQDVSPSACYAGTLNTAGGSPVK